MTLRKIIEHPLAILIPLADVIIHWVKGLIIVINTKTPFVNMFANTNWVELSIRFVLIFCIWKIYRDFNAYKDQQRIDKQKQDAKTIAAIRAVRELSENADGILLDLWIESRDRHTENSKKTVELFKQLGIKGIGTKSEDADVTKYKNKANELLDNQEDPLLKLIDDWEKA